MNLGRKAHDSESLFNIIFPFVNKLFDDKIITIFALLSPPYAGLFHLPEHLEPISILAIGYTDDTPADFNKHLENRIPVTDLVLSME